VIQRGAKNYAGPSCPGKGWTCASTDQTVVQVAATGGKNTFACASSSCAVVQVAAAPAATNTAKCIKTTGISGTCTITQSSSNANNVAIVYQKASKASGLTQTASYTATITQTATGASNTNTSCVTQDVAIDGSTNLSAKKGQPVTVTLRGHQNIAITQNSFGGNSAASGATSAGVCNGGSPLTQNQALSSTGYGTGPVTQLQNDSGDPVPGPNLNLNIKQNQGAGYLNIAGGTNTTDFKQLSTQVADASGGLTGSGFSTNGPVTQTQGKADGGLQATVNQFSTAPSTINAAQEENQCEHAQKTGTVPGNLADCLAVQRTNPLPAGWMQTQFGPMRKGADPSTQGNNAQDSFGVTQMSTQKTDVGGVTQSNVVQGDCTTSGDPNAGKGCTIGQNTNINGSTSSNSSTGSSLNLETFCNGPSCVTFNGPQISVTNTDVAESGFGGMRGGDGTGTITVSGIPDGASITKAFLWWNGPTNSADPAANAAVTFNGTPVTGTNIGISGDNNWGFQNSQSYRADVTDQVPGNGSYSLAGFVKPGGIDINGVGLIVFYRNGTTADDRNVVLWNGNDSNCLAGGVPENWDETINGVPYNGGAASLDFMVGDGQSFADGEIDLNGLPFVAAGQNFDGDSTPRPGASTPPFAPDSLWDVKSFGGLEPFLTNGSTTDLHLTSPALGDCLSLVVAAANVPVSGPIISGPTTAPNRAAQARTAPTAPAGGSGGVAR
jgi:hypothetical protein